jgi:hypothetical protein
VRNILRRKQLVNRLNLQVAVMGIVWTALCFWVLTWAMFQEWTWWQAQGIYALEIVTGGIWFKVATTGRLYRKQIRPRSKRLSIRVLFVSFCEICVRDKNTKAMIAEILEAHAEQLQMHPRKKWWRIWIHFCTVCSLVWHSIIKNLTGWPLRLLDKAIQKFHFS